MIKPNLSHFDCNTVLVTGASRGLGRELTIQLWELGFHVLAGMRNPETANLPDHSRLSKVRIDYDNDDSLVDALKAFTGSDRGIDAIVHNAGTAFVGPLESLSPQELGEIFNVNVIGPMRLTQLALPHMRSKQSGRIVFISSTRGVQSHAYMGAYSATKAALESMAFDLAVSLKNFNILVSIVRPGPISTGMVMRSGSYPIEGPAYPDLPPIDLVWQSPDIVAKQVCNILLDPEPAFAYQTSDHASDVVGASIHDPSGTRWLKEQLDWFTSGNEASST